jgi:hypothetical protein
MRSESTSFPVMDRRLWGLFVLALLLRAGFVLYHAQLGWHLQYDPGMYLTLAENLRHGVYSMFHPLDIPDTIKMPGYPAFLYVCGGNVMLVLLLQALISTIKVPLVYQLAQRVGLGQTYALAAAALMAVEPMDILLSGQVLTESLFSTLLLAGILLMLQGTRWPALLLAAVLFAAASWVRPNGVWLIVLAGIAGYFCVYRSIPKSLAFVAVGLLLLLPWALRNHSAAGRFYLGDSAAVAAAYYQVHDVLHATKDPRAITLPKALRDRAASMDWEDRNSFHGFFDGLRSATRETLLAYPFTWARIHLYKAARIYLAPGRGHIRTFFGTNTAAQYALLAISGVFSLLLVLALIVWLIHLRQLPPWLWMLLPFATYLIVSGALTTSDARFKNPAMPLLLVGAVWATQSIAHRFLARNSRFGPNSQANTN